GRRVEREPIVEEDALAESERPRRTVVRHLPRRGQRRSYSRRRRIDLDQRFEDLARRHERGRVGVPGIERRDLGRERDAKRAALLRPGWRRRRARAGWHLAGDAEEKGERKDGRATHDA